MARDVLDGTASSARSAALDAGQPKAERTLNRYLKGIRDNKSLRRTTPQETLAAQLEFLNGLELKQKGNADITSRRLFTEDELDVFASSLKLYCDMGFPMDYQHGQMMVTVRDHHPAMHSMMVTVRDHHIREKTSPDLGHQNKSGS